MKVKELIKYLQTQPPNAVVTAFLNNYGDVGIEDIHDSELQLGDINIPFDCQEYYEYNTLCDKQCQHCKEYYKPIDHDRTRHT